MAAGPARTGPMPGHQHPRPRVVVTQFATAVAASLKRGVYEAAGCRSVMTPRDHGAGGSVGHHQHAASRSPGRGGRHGHRGQPEGPPSSGPGRRARHAGVPGAGTGRRADARLAAPGEARPSQNPLFCAPEACRACHQSLARNRRSARAVRRWCPWRGHSLLLGCLGWREGVVRVLAGVSGTGRGRLSWMGRGGGAVTGVASRLDAGHAGGSTTGECRWSGTASWSRGNWRQRWSSHRDQVLPGAPRRWRCPDAPGGRGIWLSCVSSPHRIPTSPGLRRRSPQNPHGRNGIPRHTAARMLKWSC